MTKVNNQGNPNPLSALSTPRTDGAKVDLKSTQQATPVAAPSAQPRGLAGKHGGEAANVQISTDGKGRAEAMNKALDIARNTSDIREDRVAALKKQVQDGTYQVDSGKIADGMLREAIKDHLAESDER